MSQMTADQYRAHLERTRRHPALAADNIHLPAGSGTKLSALCFGVALAGLALTLLGAVVVNVKHALAAYQVGVMSVLAIALGSLFMIMIFNLVNAGWHGTVKRQWEHLFSMLPLCVLLVFPVLAIEVIRAVVAGDSGRDGFLLFEWLNPAISGTFLIEHKAGFLNAPFWLLRFVLYAAIWIFLAQRLYSLSKQQDLTGDRWLSQKARFMSGWGTLVLALTSSFAAFDWMMSMDYRFFSTMWGVYYFAASAGASVATLVIVLAILRGMGRLTGAVTDEHFRDLGKFLFAFSVFWAYIGFSQYFLIWYANIPEETAYYLRRMTGGWEALSFFLIAGHFVVPFVLLLFKPVKHSTLGLALVAGWLLVMHVLDMFWIIRPMVYVQDWASLNPGPTGWWVDVAAIVGVFALFAGVLIRKIASGPLVAANDPYLHESLKHKNYVG
ncbi:MAG: hypothetical protein EA378_01835 [Phycisphaerales bacterium]|nr:MAG: hypothetical protein EA378_01835 [Phycisphaerales bacterium]